MDSPGRIAGIDYGTVRIGIAISDTDRVIASPFETYIRCSETKDAQFFRRLVAEEEIVKLVVGLPLHLNGDLSEKAKEVMRFGQWLRDLTGLEVDYVDERFSSVEAERFLRLGKLTNKKRRDRRDKIAAQILLSSYLDASCQGISDYSEIDG